MTWSVYRLSPRNPKPQRSQFCWLKVTCSSEFASHAQCPLGGKKKKAYRNSLVRLNSHTLIHVYAWTHACTHTHWTISPSCVYNLLKQLKWYKEATLFLGYSSENKSLEHWLVLQMSGPTWLSLPLPSLITLMELSSWGPQTLIHWLHRWCHLKATLTFQSEGWGLWGGFTSAQSPTSQQADATDTIQLCWRHQTRWPMGMGRVGISKELTSHMRPVSTEEFSTTPCFPYPDSSLILYVGLEATLQDFFWDISPSSIHYGVVFYVTGNYLRWPFRITTRSLSVFCLRQWSVGILSQEATAWGSVLAGMSVLPGIICFPGLECTGLTWTLLLILCLQCQRVATV